MPVTPADRLALARIACAWAEVRDALAALAGVPGSVAGEARAALNRCAGELVELYVAASESVAPLTEPHGARRTGGVR